jgi:hypothetical protein
VSEVLRNITANGQGTLSQSFSGAFAAGASGISLRGLTVGATLVLIDGQRMAPYALSDDGQRSFVDISQIPMEAIERIEVLKDGASSIYGSDAVAGVVNVILKKHYDGAEITAEGGQSSRRDGRTAHVSGIFGSGDLERDGYNAYLALELRQQDKILVNDRNALFTNMDWTAWGGKNLTRGVPTANNGYQPASITGYLIDPDTGATTMLPGCTTAQFNAGQCAYRDRDLELQPKTRNINLLGSWVQKLDGDWQLNLKGSYFRSEAEQLNRYSTTGGVGGLSALAYGPGIPPRATPDGAPIQITVPASYPAVQLPRTGRQPRQRGLGHRAPGRRPGRQLVRLGPRGGGRRLAEHGQAGHLERLQHRQPAGGAERPHHPLPGRPVGERQQPGADRLDRPAPAFARHRQAAVRAHLGGTRADPAAGRRAGAEPGRRVHPPRAGCGGAAHRRQRRADRQ